VRKKALRKDFDHPEVQSCPGPSIESMWTDEAYSLYGPPRDTPEDIAMWFNAEGIAGPVLDIGCGNGVFGRAFDGEWIGLDRSVEQLRKASGARVLGDALHLPFPAETFDGVVALYMLYFFEEPSLVASEALRVLVPGGYFAVCAPSKFDAPELEHVTPKGEEECFMAEDIPELLFQRFREVKITVWDFPAFDLRDRATVRDYLYSWYYPQLTLEEAEHRSHLVEVPLKLSKRGAWGVGRKPR
jgi:SAM-dependent methyltransferase